MTKSKNYAPSVAADLADRFTAWLIFLESEKHFSKHTVRAYNKDLLYFFEFLTNHLGAAPSMNTLGDLALPDFRAWLSKRLANGAGNPTRARELATIRNFFRWLDKNGFLHNPYIELIKTPKQPKRLPRPLPIKQAKMLIDNKENIGKQKEWIAYRDRALFTLLYGCGLRINEALQLDFATRPKNGEVIVMGKGSKERLVPVLPIVEQNIEEYLSQAPFVFDKETPLFLGSRGKRLNQGVAQKQLRDIRKAIDLPESLTPHALRHSFATHILVNGGNLRIIQELLGHSSVSSTQCYTDFDNAQLLDIYERAHPRALINNIDKKPK